MTPKKSPFLLLLLLLRIILTTCVIVIVISSIIVVVDGFATAPPSASFTSSLKNRPFFLRQHYFSISSRSSLPKHHHHHDDINNNNNICVSSPDTTTTTTNPNNNNNILNNNKKSIRRQNQRNYRLREFCSNCNRPIQQCVCSALPPRPLLCLNEIKILIVQHPKEFKKRKTISTTPLIQLVLGGSNSNNNNVDVCVGTSLDVASNVIDDALNNNNESSKMMIPLLLYPGPNSIPINDIRKKKVNNNGYNNNNVSTTSHSDDDSSPTNFAKNNNHRSSYYMLILVDGTWGQARRMIRDTSMNLLEKCTMIQFSSEESENNDDDDDDNHTNGNSIISTYGKIRQQPYNYCLSTLEACAKALPYLLDNDGEEEEEGRLASHYLLQTLDLFVNIQIQHEIKQQQQRIIDKQQTNNNQHNHLLLLSSKLYRLRLLEGNDADFVNDNWKYQSGRKSLKMIRNYITNTTNIACLGIEFINNNNNDDDDDLISSKLSFLNHPLLEKATTTITTTSIKSMMTMIDNIEYAISSLLPMVKQKVVPSSSLKLINSHEKSSTTTSSSNIVSSIRKTMTNYYDTYHNNNDSLQTMLSSSSSSSDSQPLNNIVNVIVIVIMMMIIIFYSYYYRRMKKNNNNNRNNNTTTKNDLGLITSKHARTTTVGKGMGFDQMQILRSTRERSSTFDFFGTMNIHNNRKNNNNNNPRGIIKRERSTSLDSISGHHPLPFNNLIDHRTRSFHNNNNNNNNNKDGGGGGGGSTTELFKRERMGSMDLFYPTTNNATTTQQQQHRRGADVPIPAQLLNSNSTHDLITTKDGGGGGGGNYHNNNDDDDNNNTEGLLYDEFGLVTLSYEVEYYGPSHKKTMYPTWTPPTSWSEASRRIIPQEIMTKLKRSINMHLHLGQIKIHAPDSTGKWDSTYDINKVSIRIVPPVEGGVLNLYAKGGASKKKEQEWTEYTFDSARDAAQFQLDLIAYQVLGRTVHNIFEALSLVHRGSIAYNGPEFVLHNEERFDHDDRKNSAEGKDDDGEKEKDDHEHHPRYSSESCVAWDDAMRAMSSIPTIRIALERLWLNHPWGSNYDSTKSPTHHHHNKNKSTPSSPASPSSGGAGGGSSGSKSRKPSTEELLLADEYVNKRLLLGPVDFFRLFVPVLPESAFPQSESNRSRMEQLLSWRKRASRAAVLVRAYVASHRVVNSGWHPHSGSGRMIGGGVIDDNKLTRRLAFDVGDDNNQRDKSSRNEYYEASVSRDVLCHVRPFDYFEQRELAAAAASSAVGAGWWWWSRFISKTKSSFRQRRLVLSPYQAYSLVGLQVFKIPQDNTNTNTNNEPGNQLLHPARDPVEAFPTLLKLIADNPHLHFFVVSFFHRKSVSTFCYVRSLPEGIDPQFDNVMNRFRKGAKEYRDQRVNLMIQLGHNLELTFLGWAVLRILSFLFNLTTKGRESPLVLEATRDRTPFPAVRLSSYAETHHFGGSLQTDVNLPTNYVSLTSFFHPQSMPNQISKLLFSTLEGKLSEQVLDFTFAIEGQREDELPERALCTTRMVNVNALSVARERPSDEILNEATRNIIGVASVDQMTGMEHGIVSRNNVNGTPNRVESNPGLDAAVREVTQLLDGVQVPSRRNTKNIEAGGYPEFPSDMLTKVDNVLSLFSEQDIKRFIQSCDFDLKAASIRLVETAAWRARTFPIDTRKCRVELQNGQFFQQGFDKETNPVFYFRNMCLGPWRKHPDAVISCVLYRLDASLAQFCRTNPKTKCTVVILIGRPPSAIPPGDEIASSDVAQEGSSQVDEDGKESLSSSQQSLGGGDVSSDSCNPRIDEGERWHKHTNKELIRTLCELLASHYPDRLAHALIIRGHGKNTYFSTNLQGRAMMKQFVAIPSIRRKVKFVRKASELTQWINVDQLVTIVGGRSEVQEEAFQC